MTLMPSPTSSFSAAGAPAAAAAAAADAAAAAAAAAARAAAAAAAAAAVAVRSPVAAAEGKSNSDETLAEDDAAERGGRGGSLWDGSSTSSKSSTVDSSCNQSIGSLSSTATHPEGRRRADARPCSLRSNAEIAVTETTFGACASCKRSWQNPSQRFPIYRLTHSHALWCFGP
eukprot:CAMPEP_0203895762 /NCGR_PEP_ID=MMETSP0359-20131031/38538_1 /ASSEMBLY_ACC=CAM_ASM_000338 /TAXON_ID=268821 /ORGANISM="Scrippsiella Hangoei, Strain SHTV-5" /LENGTH=172 /DNA_ID=CAMNT_0050818305 /DNA_START=85 /DNA_END=600 /DNA_ORIENTATION=+